MSVYQVYSSRTSHRELLDEGGGRGVRKVTQDGH